MTDRLVELLERGDAVEWNGHGVQVAMRGMLEVLSCERRSG